MKKRFPEVILYLVPIPLIFVSILFGPSELLSINELAKLLISNSKSSGEDFEVIRDIVLNIRLPRVILAFLIGAALTVSGNSLQALFRNPLVSPDILGLSAGAAFGAAFSLAYGLLPLQISAFISGLLAVSLSYLLAVTYRGISTITLILAGIIVTSFFTALLTIIQFLTDPFKLQSIVHWTMGNLHTASWSKVSSAVFPITLSLIWLMLIRWKLNIVSLGDTETKAVGVNPDRAKLLIIIPATLACSSSVAVAGVVAMVGLVVPHMIRMLVGPDNIKVQPMAVVFGGSFLLCVDTISRTLTEYEIPISIFTILIAAPFFVYLLKKGKIFFRET